MEKKFETYLNEYPHSKPIIQAHVEGQYDYEIIFDDDALFGILFTTFDKHFTFGKVPSNVDPFVDILRNYSNLNKSDELVLFAPNLAWEEFLGKVFASINGCVDVRVLYYLNEDIFREFDTTNEYVILELKNETESKNPYPQASVYLNGKLISYARSLMTGAQEAELDVWTDKRFRQKGFGFDSSISLIEYLLNTGIKPNWSCWKQKNISNQLAQKLGFEKVKEYNAYVWVHEFGSF